MSDAASKAAAPPKDEKPTAETQVAKSPDSKVAATDAAETAPQANGPPDTSVPADEATDAAGAVAPTDDDEQKTTTAEDPAGTPKPQESSVTDTTSVKSDAERKAPGGGKSAERPAEKPKELDSAPVRVPEVVQHIRSHFGVLAPNLETVVYRNALLLKSVENMYCYFLDHAELVVKYLAGNDNYSTFRTQIKLMLTTILEDALKDEAETFASYIVSLTSPAEMFSSLFNEEYLRYLVDYVQQNYISSQPQSYETTEPGAGRGAGRGLATPSGNSRQSQLTQSRQPTPTQQQSHQPPSPPLPQQQHQQQQQQQQQHQQQHQQQQQQQQQQQNATIPDYRQQQQPMRGPHGYHNTVNEYTNHNAGYRQYPHSDPSAGMDGASRPAPPGQYDNGEYADYNGTNSNRPGSRMDNGGGYRPQNGSYMQRGMDVPPGGIAAADYSTSNSSVGGGVPRPASQQSSVDRPPSQSPGSSNGLPIGSRPPAEPRGRPPMSWSPPHALRNDTTPHPASSAPSSVPGQALSNIPASVSSPNSIPSPLTPPIVQGGVKQAGPQHRHSVMMHHHHHTPSPLPPNGTLRQTVVKLPGQMGVGGGSVGNGVVPPLPASSQQQQQQQQMIAPQATPPPPPRNPNIPVPFSVQQQQLQLQQQQQQQQQQQMMMSGRSPAAVGVQPPMQQQSPQPSPQSRTTFPPPPVQQPARPQQIQPSQLQPPPPPQQQQQQQQPQIPQQQQQQKLHAHPMPSMVHHLHHHNMHQLPRTSPLQQPPTQPPQQSPQDGMNSPPGVEDGQLRRQSSGTGSTSPFPQQPAGKTVLSRAPIHHHHHQLARPSLTSPMGSATSPANSVTPLPPQQPTALGQLSTPPPMGAPVQQQPQFPQRPVPAIDGEAAGLPPRTIVQGHHLAHHQHHFMQPTTARPAHAHHMSLQPPMQAPPVTAHPTQGQPRPTVQPQKDTPPSSFHVIEEELRVVLITGGVKEETITTILELGMSARELREMGSQGLDRALRKSTPTVSARQRVWSVLMAHLNQQNQKEEHQQQQDLRSFMQKNAITTAGQGVTTDGAASSVSRQSPTSPVGTTPQPISAAVTRTALQVPQPRTKQQAQSPTQKSPLAAAGTNGSNTTSPAETSQLSSELDSSRRTDQKTPGSGVGTPNQNSYRGRPDEGEDAREEDPVIRRGGKRGGRGGAGGYSRGGGAGRANGGSEEVQVCKFFSKPEGCQYGESCRFRHPASQ